MLNITYNKQVTGQIKYRVKLCHAHNKTMFSWVAMNTDSTCNHTLLSISWTKYKTNYKNLGVDFLIQ